MGAWIIVIRKMIRIVILEYLLIRASRGESLFSGFIQDEITLIEDRLKLIIGSKFEHNDHTGFEIQPNARFSVDTPYENHTLWGSVARALQTPSRFADDLRSDILFYNDHNIGLDSVEE